MADGAIPVRTNSQIEFNFGTFNVPTIVGMLGIAGLIFSAGGRVQRAEQTIEMIQAQRRDSVATYEQRLRSLEQDAVKSSTMEYRLTKLEAADEAAAERDARQGDAIAGMRDDMSSLKTSIQVIISQLDQLSSAKPPVAGR